MNHNVAGRKFGRTANQRKALFRGLICSLFERERIETTVARAKAIKATAEKMVTFGKRGDLHAKRVVMSYIPNRAVVAKLFAEIAPRFAERNGGYLRIVQTRQRVNDGLRWRSLSSSTMLHLKAGKSASAEAASETPAAEKKEAKGEEAVGAEEGNRLAPAETTEKEASGCSQEESGCR
jgi:large subunit ribosomal protein L17